MSVGQVKGVPDVVHQWWPFGKADADDIESGIGCFETVLCQIGQGCFGNLSLLEMRD